MAAIFLLSADAKICVSRYLRKI